MMPSVTTSSKVVVVSVAIMMDVELCCLGRIVCELVVASVTGGGGSFSFRR